LKFQKDGTHEAGTMRDEPWPDRVLAADRLPSRS
jgi:hypothetical protein